MAPQLVWLITGTTSGLGRELALEVLRRGEKVIATGRAYSVEKVLNPGDRIGSIFQELREHGADILELDVTDPLGTLRAVAKKAVAIYGRVDVLVNNAGYLLVGAIEENTPEETFDQFNTNVFGALNVTRAFLPYMREKRTGTVIFVGSIGGWRSAPYAGIYATTKWALRGISESLHDEISPLGLRSVCIDFGYFRTSFLEADKRAPRISRISDYQELCNTAESRFAAFNGKQPGDPLKGVKVMVDLVRGEGAAAGKPFPRSLALGTDCYKVVESASQSALTGLEEWKDVSFSTDFQA